MYCKNCGNEIKNNARFCPKCGTKTRWINVSQKQFDVMQRITIASLVITIFAVIIVIKSSLNIARIVFFISLITYLIGMIICVIISKIYKLKFNRAIGKLKFITDIILILACIFGPLIGIAQYQDQKKDDLATQLGIQHNEEYAKEQKEKLLTELVGEHKAIYGGSGYLQLNKDYSFKMQCTDNYGSKINIEGTFYFSNGSIILKIKKENGYDLGNLSYTQEVAIASDNLAFGYTFKFER